MVFSEQNLAADHARFQSWAFILHKKQMYLTI